MAIARKALKALGIAFILLFGLAALRYGYKTSTDAQRTPEVVAFIQSQTITLADVTGENLPPTPDPSLVNATVEGVDANGNLIRDDVELEIFARYPDDPVVRSAMLQYALGLQLELTQVFNSETWVAAVQESTRGFLCVALSGAVLSSESTQEEVNTARALGDKRVKEVEDLVFDSELRERKKHEVSQYLVSLSESDKEKDCDIDPVTLMSDSDE